MPELALPIQGYDNQVDPMGYALPVAQPIPADIPRVYIRPEPDVIPTRDEPILHASGKQLKAVDHDPWANLGMAGVEDKSGQSEHPLLKQLFGLGGESRVQLWPERMVRAGVTAAGNVMSGQTPQWAVDPETGDVHTSPQMIEAGLDTAALAGTGGLAGTTEATLGSGPFLRPALKHEGKIYKGKEGQQHLDVLPKELQADFNQKAMTGEDISHYNFGFMNHKGQFLNREAALDYAVKEGLVDPTAGQYGALTSTLLSDSSKPGIAIEAMKKPTFYSALEHNVNNIGQAKMTGDQWLGTLANKPGVKPEELQWTGLKDFLEENKGKPVTKEQIQQHLEQNKVALKEVVKGNEGPKVKLPYNRDEEGRLVDTSADTKYHSYQLPGGPLSRDTEILTNKSWKRIDAIEIGDIIMTRKDEGDILEWQPVLAAPQIYAENLYHFFNQSIDMRVTENHQMVVKKRRRNGKGIFRTTAKELWNMSECVVPLTGVWAGEGNKTIFGFNANDLAELVGWYLAEGSYKHNGEGVKNTIQISQCIENNYDKCQRLQHLLDRMSIPWRYYGDAYGLGIKSMNEDLKNLFHSQPTSEGKYIPEFFFNESKSVIQSLLDGLILGDGCVKVQPNRLDATMFFTKSERLAGDVQALVLMSGKRASVRQRPSGLYCVGINTKEWSGVDDAKYEIAPYNDIAYCVTVENHSIYVRRNGVAAFTGNSNYREMLMTLPDKNNIRTQLDPINKRMNEINELPARQHTPEIVKEFDTLNAQRKALMYDENGNVREAVNPYKSSHWDEPNILAHVRMNDRTIDGKKSLHLEEIQSDWHQGGREKGYADSKKPYEVFDPVTAEIKNRYATEAEAKKAAAENPKLDYSKSEGVPDAPFKKTWHELALKRMLREAAEKGYDRLSWTPGEAQAARYDLSHQMDNIEVFRNPNGTYDLKGKIAASSRGSENLGSKSIGDQIPSIKLADIVGKEMADKIIKQPDKYKKYEGLDLKVGGEGMKGFYDKMIPNALEKMGKEHGVKVKSANLDYPTLSNKIGEAPKENTVHYIDIPQSLKDTVLRKGQPLFSSAHPGVTFSQVDHDPFTSEDKTK